VLCIRVAELSRSLTFWHIILIVLLLIASNTSNLKFYNGAYREQFMEELPFSIIAHQSIGQASTFLQLDMGSTCESPSAPLPLRCSNKLGKPRNHSTDTWRSNGHNPHNTEL